MKDCFAATHFIYLLNNFTFFAMYFIINIPCHKSIFFQYNKIRGKEFFQNQNKKNRTLMKISKCLENCFSIVLFVTDRILKKF
jgi:hypothetical protein